MRLTSAAVVAAAVVAVGTACTGSDPGRPGTSTRTTHRCAGNDEVFTGPEGPCPFTGTISGVLKATGGPNAAVTFAPGPGASVQLNRDGSQVARQKTAADGSFQFHVQPGAYTVEGSAFGSLRCGPVN